MAEPRWPIYTALIAAAAYIATVQSGIYHPAGNGVADAVIFLVTAPAVAGLSVALGLLLGRIASVSCLAVVTVALMWGDPNPFPAVITIGFWLVGLALGSHRRLTLTLKARAAELDAGRDAYVAGALRYEHVRIARELHDIVAHSLSVIVIQASAGQRLPPDDPSAPELLRIVRDLTHEVRADIDGLTRLLDETADLRSCATKQSIDELLNRSAATGSPVTCNLPDDFDQLPGRLSAVVYRILQEGVTNAIKHAPGAPIDILVAGDADVRVAVTNAAVRTRIGAATVPGSGRGIAGLTERVHAANGTFASGPTAEGGWQLIAQLPR